MKSLAAQGKHIASGVPANPVFLPAPAARSAARSDKSFTTSAPPEGRAPAARKPLAQHPNHFLGFFWSSLFGVTARNPLRDVQVFFGSLQRDRRSTSSATCRAPVFGCPRGSRGARDLRRAEDRDHLRRTFFQQSPRDRQHHPEARPLAGRGGPDIGSRRRDAGPLPGRSCPASPWISTTTRGSSSAARGHCSIVAEDIGASSGITFFINQQAKYRIYDNVFAAIIIIRIHGIQEYRPPARPPRAPLLLSLAETRASGLLKTLRESRRKGQPA